MNAEQLDLARRLAAHPRYRPSPTVAGHRRRRCGTLLYREEQGRIVPDLTDDATGGVLLGMLLPGYLEYFPEERIWLTRRRPAPDAPYHAGKTLAEACARALLAEWGET